MKPTTFSALALLILVASQAAIAQSPFSIGIKSGIAASHLRAVTISNPSSIRTTFALKENTISPLISVFVFNRSIDFLPVALELQYYRSGGARTGTIPLIDAANPDSVSSYVDYRSEVGLHYLTLALSVEPTLDLGAVQLFASFAPTFNYLMLVDNFSPTNSGYDWTIFGYQIGGGFRLPWNDVSAVSFAIGYRDHFNHFYTGNVLYGSGFVRNKYYSETWLATIGVTL